MAVELISDGGPMWALDSVGAAVAGSTAFAVGDSPHLLRVELIDASFSAYWPFTDFRFDYAMGGGGTIDMGCYPQEVADELAREANCVFGH